MKDVCRLYESGQIQEAVRRLRRHRLRLMEKLHESQSRVDCLDFLIHRMKKGGSGE